jgi:hypothetical protein
MNRSLTHRRGFILTSDYDCSLRSSTNQRFAISQGPIRVMESIGPWLVVVSNPTVLTSPFLVLPTSQKSRELPDLDSNQNQLIQSLVVHQTEKSYQRPLLSLPCKDIRRSSEDTPPRMRLGSKKELLLSRLVPDHLSGSDRNVTGVGPRLDRSKPRIAALRGSPRPALRSHPGNSAREPGEGRLKGVRVH